MGPNSRLSVATSVYARVFGDGEMVLLDFARGEYFGLDEVGAEVWRGLEAGRSLDAIAEHVVERFDVIREDALRDVVALVTEMRENLLVNEGAGT